MALLSKRLLHHSRAVFGAVPPPWRSYSQPSHNRRTPTYLSYRKGLTNLRLQFIEEQKLAKKMMAEDSNSQAAQEARKEREREAKALEENEKELIKMAEIRF